MTNDDLAMLDMERPADAPPSAATGAPAGLPPVGVPAPIYTPPPPPTPLPPPAAVPPAQGSQVPPPAIAPPGLAPPTMTGAVPTKSVTDREITSVTSHNKLDPGEQASMLAGKQAVDERARLALEKGDLESEATKVKAQEERHKATLLAMHGADLKQIADSATAHLAAIDQEHKAAEEKWKNATPKDFWEGDEGGSRKFWGGVAMALGGLAASRTGGRNLAYEQIKDAVDRHDRLEQARIAKLKETADRIGKGRDWEITQEQRLLANAAAKKAGMLELGATQLEARMGQLTGDAQINAAKETAAKLRQDASVTQSQFFNDAKTEIKNQVVTKTQSIVGGAGAGAADKPINQWKPEERKAEGFAMRAHKASEEMDRFKYNPKDMAVLTGAARREALQGGITGMADKAWKLLNVSTYNQLSPEGKKRYNATREFIISGLRPESGAAISLGELADAEQRYGTVPGDTKDTAPQKKQNRMAKIAEVGMQSGRPQFWITTTGAYGQPAAAPAAPATPAPAKTGGLPAGAVAGTLKGQRGYALGGKFYPLEVAQR